MSIPAGQLRKSRIQWHDDGSPQRARNVFMADGSPYRALGLAAILGALSIAAVVAVIQFQRQGGLPDVGSTLVEQAQASPETPAIEQAAAAPVNEPQIAPATAAMAESTAQPPADTVAAPAAAPKVEIAKAGTTTARARSAAPAAAATNQVEAIRADEAAAASIEPMTVTDPRWQAVETASAPAKAPIAAQSSEPQPMAFAAIEPPAVVPAPKPAQRSKQTTASAEKPQPELVAASAEVAGAKVRSSVFLRSRPADGSSVLVTIPGGASVQVDTGCRHWCAVTYQGKRGFVYKSFLSR